MQRESGEDAIQEWELALSSGTAHAYLESLELREMAEEDIVALLSALLLSMHDVGVYDDVLLDEVLSTFEILRQPFSRQSPMSSVIVSVPLMDLGAVSYVWLRKQVDIMTVVLDLADWLPNEQAGIVMGKVVSIFLREDIEQIYDVMANPSREGGLHSLLSATRIGFLMDEAEKRGNDGLWNWLRPEFAENAPVVGAGPWMLDQAGTSLPLPPSYIVTKGVSDRVLTRLEELPPSSAHTAIAIVRCEATIQDSKTRREVYEIEDNRFKSESEEREMFRLYGPSNVFLIDESEDVDEYPPGADRMFTCDVYNYNEEDEEMEPIYTGVCDWRGHRISSERAAVRRPVPGGGWMGSYCSTTCVREQVRDQLNTGLEADIEGTLAMIDTMEKQLLEWKIYQTIQHD